MPLNATCLGVGFSPLVASRARASAFSTTDSVTMIEREAARALDARRDVHRLAKIVLLAIECDREA